MLKAEDTILVLVDLQDKLARQIPNIEDIKTQIVTMIKVSHLLAIPVLWIEHMPDKLGQTLPQIKGLLAGRTPIVKSCFSACGEPRFMQELTLQNRRQVVLCGIETHVCIYQTAADLVQLNYHVEVLADAVSSRTPANRDLGLTRIRELAPVGAGSAHVTGVEMAVFELLRTPEHPAFKEVLKLLK